MGDADTSFGDRIRGYRLRLGLTQATVAARAGITVRALREIEHGRIRPRDRRRAALDGALGLSPEPTEGRAPPQAGRLAVNVLGPLEAHLDGQPVEIRSTAQRDILGALAIQPGYPVTAAQLADILWAGRPPATWRNLVHVHVNRLRALLEPGRPRRAPARAVVSIDGAYRLDLDADHTDLVAFEQLVERAGDTSDESVGRRLYREALARWRGPVLAGGNEQLRQHPAAVALHRRRLHATLAYAELAMAADRHADALPWITDLVRYEPMNEALHAQLMLALAGSGEQAAAFALYTDIRTRLADELGVDPGPEIQAAYRQILRRGAAAAPGSPAQLPDGIADFVGRVGVLRALDRWLAGPTGGRTVAITGGAGSGKTTLAVRWARRTAAALGSGHLYVNLNGHADGAPMPPVAALAGFLRALGVVPDQVPVDVEEAAARYRGLLADRPMVVLLDNAHNSAQVRPLLPGGSAAVVIVTSRDRLGGLAVRPGAHRIELGALPPDDANAMIARIIGAGRTLAEPDAAAELARRCAYLPLALRIAAANLTDRRYRRIADLVADLTTDGWPDALDMDGDPDASVKVSFDHSYRGVTPSAQRLFRLLGLVPGPDFTEDTAHALTGGPTGRDLRDLVTAHLVEQTAPDRYTMHDLLRRYAVEAGRGTDSPAERHAAHGRLYHHYARATDTAARAVYPQILRLPTDVAPAAAADPGAALAWLDGERHNIIAAIHRAESDGFAEQTWILADTLRGYFSLRRFMPEWLAAATAALAAAERAGDAAGQVSARMSRAQVLWGLGRHRDAAASLVPAVHLARELDWPDGVAACLGNLGGIHGDWGRPADALAYLSAARRVFRKQGTPAMTEANQLTNLGAVCYDLGRLAEAAEHNRAALRLYTVIGAPVGVAQSRANLAQVLMAQGSLDRAARELAEALDGFRALGERHGEAAALIDLARLHAEIGHREAAARCADQAFRAAQEANAPRWVSGALTVLGQVHRRPALHLCAVHEAAGTRYDELTAVIGLAATLTVTGAPGAAEQHATRALAVARDTGYRLLEGHALLVLAEARPDGRERVHLAGLACDIYRECGSPGPAYRAGRIAGA